MAIDTHRAKRIGRFVIVFSVDRNDDSVAVLWRWESAANTYIRTYILIHQSASCEGEEMHLLSK